MTVTTLDPTTALIVVDLQNAVMTIPTDHLVTKRARGDFTNADLNVFPRIGESGTTAGILALLAADA